MIAQSVGHIASRLNQHLRRTYDLGEEIVVVSNLMDLDGVPAPDVENRMVVFVANLQRDTFPHRTGTDAAPAATRVAQVNAPIYLNLFVMLAANFAGGNYAEALKFLTTAVEFFQLHPVFDHSNSPDLDPEIERLVVEMQNLDIDELSNLWTVLTGRYVPSVLYRVRMIAIGPSTAVQAEPHAVDAPRSTVSS